MCVRVCVCVCIHTHASNAGKWRCRGFGCWYRGVDWHGIHPRTSHNGLEKVFLERSAVNVLPNRSIRQRTSAYVSIRQHTSAYVFSLIPTGLMFWVLPNLHWLDVFGSERLACPYFRCMWPCALATHRASTYMIMSQASAYVSIRQHTSAYVSEYLYDNESSVSMRQHTSA
jgi:hypothetical protein